MVLVVALPTAYAASPANANTAPALKNIQQVYRERQARQMYMELLGPKSSGRSHLPLRGFNMTVMTNAPTAAIK